MTDNKSSDRDRELRQLRERIAQLEQEIEQSSRLQQELRESEARLKMAQQLAHIGHWDWNPATGALTWSEEHYRIFSLPPDTKPSLDVFLASVHPDDVAFIRSAIRDALEGSKDYDFDFRIVRPDGTIRFAHTTGHVERDATGSPVRMFGTVMDITDRKAAEDAVIRTDARYYNLFESLDVAVLLMRGQVCIECNPATLKLFGLTSTDEIVGKTPLDFAVPVQPNGMTAEEMAHWNIQMALKKGQHAFEWQAHRKNGEAFTLEVRLLPYSVHGEQHFQCIALDISARKQNEEALRNSEKIVRTMIDAVDEGFIVLDREYRIVTANAAYARMFAEGAPVVGRHCYEVVHQEERPCFENDVSCAARLVFETGKPQSLLHKRQDADANAAFFDTKAFPILDRDGTVISVIETISNVTEKMLLEEERLKTQKLEAIGALAGGIAHDFNNLLQGVFGYIAMARSTYDQKDRCMEMLGQAEQALELSVKLTKQLLAFSKGGKPVKSLISLSSVIENAVKFGLSGAKTGYSLEIPDDLWMAEADEGQLSQVIQNIVLNADQAMPLGGTVSVEARNVQVPAQEPGLPLPAGSYVRISVRDTGIGIPVRYLGKIFDPYFTTKEKGSGLGLATSYSIIKNHGGMIDVSSQPGSGSQFSIYLPAIAAGAETAPEPLAVAPPRRGRILFMDDDPLIRTIAREMLGELGHSTDFAEHGEEALWLYRRSLETGARYDVVILDLTVRGGMGGKETIKQMRALDPNVKAVVSSGYSADSIVSDYEAYGFKACLIKPYELGLLRTTLNQLLR